MTPRIITITPVLNGYSVRVGCQLLAFESAKTMLKELQTYLAHPALTEARYRKSAVNKSILTDVPAPLMYGTGDTMTMTLGTTPQAYTLAAPTPSTGR